MEMVPLLLSMEGPWGFIGRGFNPPPLNVTPFPFTFNFTLPIPGCLRGVSRVFGGSLGERRRGGRRVGGPKLRVFFPSLTPNFVLFFSICVLVELWPQFKAMIHCARLGLRGRFQQVPAVPKPARVTHGDPGSRGSFCSDTCCSFRTVSFRLCLFCAD